MREDCARMIGQAELIATLHPELAAFCAEATSLLRELGEMATRRRHTTNRIARGTAGDRLSTALADGPLRMSEIARAMGIPLNNCGALLDQYTFKGLVRRVERGVYELVPNGLEATDGE